MPKILMLRTTRGSDNGMVVNTYEAKETYVVGDKLADTFVNTLKVAELMPMRSSAPVESKDAKGSRENKDASADKEADKDVDKEEKRSRRS